MSRREATDGAASWRPRLSTTTRPARARSAVERNPTHIHGVASHRTVSPLWPAVASAASPSETMPKCRRRASISQRDVRRGGGERLQLACMRGSDPYNRALGYIPTAWRRCGRSCQAAIDPRRRRAPCSAGRFPALASSGSRSDFRIQISVERFLPSARRPWWRIPLHALYYRISAASRAVSSTDCRKAGGSEPIDPPTGRMREMRNPRSGPQQTWKRVAHATSRRPLALARHPERATTSWSGPQNLVQV
jgi:hypothetical protein